MTQPVPDFTHANHAFKPQTSAGMDGWNASVTVAGGTGGATSGALPTRDPGFNYLRIANTTTGWVYVNIGDANVAAATVAASYPVPPNTDRIVGVEPWMTDVSVINAVAGNVIFTLGQGIS